MSYLFTSESVSEGHPDKIADQISDALVDHFIAFDPKSKVACETLVTTGQVILAGEVKSKTYLDAQEIARDVIRKIGYTKSEYMFEANSCGVLSAIHEQSPDINQGVDKTSEQDQGAGDQGIMFGYATDETSNYMPLALEVSHILLQELAQIRHEGKFMNYLRPDSKSQVTIRYNDHHEPEGIDTIVLSTQHDEFDSELDMQKKIANDIQEYLIPLVKKRLPQKIQELFTQNINYLINPTGKFVIGGPHGDTGLTGRKIIVDTYGGKGAHGGGAFSGKDPSKVDRSAAYAARYVAKNIVAAGVAKQVLVQLAYAIGVAEPVGFYLNTYGTASVIGNNGDILSDGDISSKLKPLFDLRPFSIESKFGLREPIYSETAAYGHMGRKNEVVTKTFKRPSENGMDVITKEVELFTWEKLDAVSEIQSVFNFK
jgi:S-adenosylmethionine synthetase|tara:strand:+ start:1316 stop:2599 length:1284 start_codon:yes stop_codon:yes gene_type:complete